MWSGCAFGGCSILRKGPYVRAAGIRIGGLEAFEDGGFDLRNDLSSLTEKGIDVLRTDLAALDIECAEELRKAVHANYIPFIAASQVIRQACI